MRLHEVGFEYTDLKLVADRHKEDGLMSLALISCLNFNSVNIKFNCVNVQKLFLEIKTEEVVEASRMLTTISGEPGLRTLVLLIQHNRKETLFTPRPETYQGLPFPAECLEGHASTIKNLCIQERFNDLIATPQYLLPEATFDIFAGFRDLVEISIALEIDMRPRHEVSFHPLILNP